MSPQPDAISLKLSPNPASNFIQVNWVSDQSTPVRLIVSDVNGRILSQQNYGYVMPGIHQEDISVSNFSDGIYLLTIHEGGKNITARFLVSK